MSIDAISLHFSKSQSPVVELSLVGCLVRILWALVQGNGCSQLFKVVSVVFYRVLQVRIKNMKNVLEAFALYISLLYLLEE